MTYWISEGKQYWSRWPGVVAFFIRVDEIPTGIKVALNDEQNLFCTITFSTRYR